VEFRLTQQLHLWKSLESLKTPSAIVEAIKAGLSLEANTCTVSFISPKSHLTDDNSAGSITHDCSLHTDDADPVEVLIARTSQQQSILGWEHLLRGRISRLWGDAFRQSLMQQNQKAEEDQWPSKVVHTLLTYSSSIWRHCCSLLHGATEEASRNIKLRGLQSSVRQAYAAFASDPYYVSQSLSHIFNIPLQQWL
jgi:hypothetical protein